MIGTVLKLINPRWADQLAVDDIELIIFQKILFLCLATVGCQRVQLRYCLLYQPQKRKLCIIHVSSTVNTQTLLYPHSTPVYEYPIHGRQRAFPAFEQ